MIRANIPIQTPQSPIGAAVKLKNVLKQKQCEVFSISSTIQKYMQIGPSKNYLYLMWLGFKSIPYYYLNLGSILLHLIRFQFEINRKFSISNLSLAHCSSIEKGGIGEMERLNNHQAQLQPQFSWADLDLLSSFPQHAQSQYQQSTFIECKVALEKIC